jgi:ribonucleoside-diphosphate reductase alpha chain
MEVVKRDGTREPVDRRKVLRSVERACRGLADVDAKLICDEACQGLFESVTTADIDRATVLSAKARIPYEPNYSYVAARLLLYATYRESFGKRVDGRTIATDVRHAFVTHLKTLEAAGVIDPRVLELFDLDALAAALEPGRDLAFKFLGMKTLFDRYLLRMGGRVLETPQAFWMRVAMGVNLNEKDPTAAALETYSLTSTFRYTHATPTLFNAGTTRPQLSSCYLSTLEDSIDGIYGTLHGQARLSKFAGGLGMDVTPLRGTGALINGTGGDSQGLVPWLKQFNDMCLAVNQGGRRPGKMACYLEPWHVDILEFLDVRKNTGDDRRRCHDLHTALWFPDLFFKQVEADGEWYLFTPNEVPDLHETFGEEFERRYWGYATRAEAGELKVWRKLKAKDLLKKILTATKETGHPWWTFKDAFNIRYANKHVGVIHSSNLCCVTGDQRAVTDRGTVRVADLYAEGGNVLVAGRNGFERASHMNLTIKDSPIVRVVTAEGYSHKVTPDHPLWVVERGWVEAKDLKPGDRVELQQTKGLFGTHDDPDLAYLCGLVAGDGTYGGSSVHIDLWDKDLKLAGEIEKVVARTLCRHSAICKFRYVNSSTPTFNDAEGGRKKRLGSVPLSQVMTEHGFTKETKLVVPEFVWRGTRETVSAYIRGLLLTDGTIQAADKLMTSLSLASVSRELLESVQVLLINLGVKSRVKRMHAGGPRMMPNGCGGKTEYQCAPLYRLLVTSTKSCRALEEATRFGETRGHSAFLANLNRDGYAEKWSAVVSSVEPLPNEDVYCLMVDADDRAWTCNGLVTKNTEIGEHTTPSRYENGEKVEVGETATCNLASVNLVAHQKSDGEVDWDMLAVTVRSATRRLDNVICLNFYPTAEAEKSNMANRPVGLGLMGWADFLASRRVAFDSAEAERLADEIQAFVSYHAIATSAELAVERGAYPNYRGSTWSEGKLPIDTFAELMSSRGEPVVVQRAGLDWSALRKVVKGGMRNGLLQAIAPTATIANIVGCSESIDAHFSNLHVKSTLSGDNVIVNEFFVKELKGLGLWSKEMADELLTSDGDATHLDIPSDLKTRYKTAFQWDQKRAVDVAAARQKWICQGQSFNVYFDGDSMRALKDIYFHAWRKGLPSTYYLHTRAASKVEKSVQAKSEPAQCRIDNPECESCS